MTNAFKKIMSVLLIAAVSALCTAGCSTEENLQQQPEPDISDTVSATAAAKAKGTETEKQTDETATSVTTSAVTTTSATTTAAAAPVTTTTKPAPVTTTTPKATTTTTPKPTTTTTKPPAATTTAKPPATTTTTKPPASAAPSAPSSDFAEEVFRLVNQIRLEYGLPEFKELDALTNAAQKRAAEISGYYSHTRPSGQQSYSVMKEYGLSYSYTGENIAAGQMTPQEVVNAWMSSTMGHREAILSSNYRYMGVGYVCLTSGDRQGYKYYWTQEFYTPL